MPKQHVLYLGLTPPNGENIVHCPLIEIIPRDSLDVNLSVLDQMTHLIFTSKNGVKILFEKVATQLCESKICVSVGSSTTKSLQERGMKNIITASIETAEGVVQLLQKNHQPEFFYFWGHAAKARPIIVEGLTQMRAKFLHCVLYDTIVRPPKTEIYLNDFAEIIFTSPSTVEAFLQIFDSFPKRAKLTAIGPITSKFLKKKITELNGRE